MDVLKAEIERKKRQMAEKNVMAAPGKKYFKRSDLSAKQREEYLERFGPKKEDVEQVKEIYKAKDECKVKLTTPTNKDDGVPPLPRVEVVRRLRERLQPVLLFGETEALACDRLRKLELDEPEPNEGLRNDYKEALDQVDQAFVEETAQGPSSKRDKSKADVDLYDSTYTYDDLLKMVADVDKGEPEHDHKVVAEFVRVMMTLWGQALNKRPEEEKLTVMGKRETGIYAQTRTYLKPLLRMLKKQTVTDDVRDSLVKMVKYTLQRDYILSHEAYMEMAVGNAPWPIGVTNAGIHARPARENIFSKNVAHVLNDETQRKYIQGLKRLLTKAQAYFPTDPSRSIDYVRKEETPEKNA